MSDDEREPEGPPRPKADDDEPTPRALSPLAAFGWSCVGVFFAMTAVFVSLSVRPGLSLDIVNNIACSALGFTVATEASARRLRKLRLPRGRSRGPSARRPERGGFSGRPDNFSPRR